MPTTWKYFICPQGNEKPIHFSGKEYRSQKNDRPVQWGKGATIESVFKSLASNEQLIRVFHKGGKTDVFTPNGNYRKWERHPILTLLPKSEKLKVEKAKVDTEKKVLQL